MDIAKSYSLCGRVVDINHEGRVFNGYLYTIDPISQTAVLLKKKSDSNYDVEVIVGVDLDSVRSVGEDVLPIDVMESLFLSKEVHRSRQVVVDPAVLAVRKEALIALLKDHRLPVETRNDDVCVMQVTIKPPYTVEQCYCQNQIVLKRIRDIVVSIGNIVAQ